MELNKFSKGDGEKKRWERKELESLPRFQAHPKDDTPLLFRVMVHGLLILAQYLLPLVCVVPRSS